MYDENFDAALAVNVSDVLMPEQSWPSCQHLLENLALLTELKAAGLMILKPLGGRECAVKD